MESHRIKIDEVGYNRFTMTPNRWKRDFNAIGIIPSSGKYSKGTFAHPDIAFEFASWLSPEFKLYLIKEFERLKTNEAYQYKIEWSATRLLSKVNYVVHTDAIKECIIPNLTESQKQHVYSDEADILNVALFGMTAKEWRESNPALAKNGNIRDYTDLLHLVILNNLENTNAELIEAKVSQSERLVRLNNSVRRQMKVLKDNKEVRSAPCGSLCYKPLITMRMRVQSLRPLNGLRIGCCRELWCRSQAWLGSGVAMAVM